MFCLFFVRLRIVLYGKNGWNGKFYHGLRAFNYVAQPGDGVKEITPKMGRIKFAINWAYHLVRHETPQEELPILNEWIKSMKETQCIRMASNKTQKIQSILVLRMKTFGDDIVKANRYEDYESETDCSDY
ncbi:MAG: zinc-dependent metalloprotease [Butyricimonas faecihominis]